MAYLGNFIVIGHELFPDINSIINHVGFAEYIQFGLQQLVFIVYLKQIGVLEADVRLG